VGGAVAVVGVGVVVATLGAEEEGGQAEETGNGKQHGAEGEAGGVHHVRARRGAGAGASSVNPVWRRSAPGAAGDKLPFDNFSDAALTGWGSQVFGQLRNLRS
jgi:hypothetical protein